MKQNQDVPDELAQEDMERMERLRERMGVDRSTFIEMTKRFSEQKAQAQKDSYAEGHEVAVEFLKTANYEQILTLFRETQGEGFDDVWVLDSFTQHFRTRGVNISHIFGWPGYFWRFDEHPPLSRSHWLRGWLDAIQDFWFEINPEES